MLTPGAVAEFLKPLFKVRIRIGRSMTHKSLGRNQSRKAAAKVPRKVRPWLLHRELFPPRSGELCGLDVDLEYCLERQVLFKLPREVTIQDLGGRVIVAVASYRWCLPRLVIAGGLIADVDASLTSSSGRISYSVKDAPPLLAAIDTGDWIPWSCMKLRTFSL